MRRVSIYPHRSIRAIPAGGARWVLAGLTAIALTTACVILRSPLLMLHNQLCLSLLHLAGIPISGAASVELFTRLGSAAVPMVPVTEIGSHPLRLWTMFSAAMLVFLGLHRRIPFARSFVLFLAVLLAMAVAVVTLHASSQFGSSEFAIMWLRGEFLVWLALPWFSAAMFVLMQPAAWFGAGWAVLMQIYGFLWSGIRLALCVAVMHYSGILFVPILWFVLGLLADVIYLLVFYSVLLQWSAKRAWGNRAQ